MVQPLLKSIDQDIAEHLADEASYRAQQQREARAPRSDIAPAYPVDEEMPVFALVLHAKQHVDQFFDRALRPVAGRVSRLAIRATCGTGKTTVAGERAIARRPESGIVEWAMPSETMSRQLAAQLARQGEERVHVVVGRNPDNCENYDRVKLAVDSGVMDVSRVICATCPMRTGCAYFAQRDAGGLPGHTIYSHAALQQPRPTTWQIDPVAVIIDEAPALAKIETFDLSVLGRGRTGEERAVLAAIKAGASIYMASIESLTGLPAETSARDHRRRAREIVEAAARYHNVRRKALLRALTATTRDTSEVGERKFARLAYRMRHHNAWLAVLHALQLNLNKRQRLMRVRLEDDKVKTMRPAAVTRMSTTPRHILGVPRPLPTLYLDGTADPLLAEHLMQAGIVEDQLDFRFVRLDAKINAKVIQIKDQMCSASTFKESEALQGDVAQLAAQHAQRGEKVLVVGATKELAGKLAIILGAIDAGAGEIASIHAGDCRGRNDWEDFTVIILAGIIRTPISVAEDEAIAIRGEIDMLLTDVGTRANIADMNESSWSHRGYRMVDGSLRGVAVPVHPDPFVDAVWRQSSDAISAQALHRLRMVHLLDQQGNRRPEKLAVIMTKEVLDFPVDRLVPRREILARSADLALTALAGAFERTGGLLMVTKEDLIASGAYPSASAARDCPVASAIRRVVRNQVELIESAGAEGGEVAPTSLIDTIAQTGLTPPCAGISIHVALAAVRESRGGQRPVILIRAPQEASKADLLAIWHEAGRPALADIEIVARIDHVEPAEILQIEKRAAEIVIERASEAKEIERLVFRQEQAAHMRAEIEKERASRPIREEADRIAAEHRAAFEAAEQAHREAIDERRRLRAEDVLAGKLRQAVYAKIGSLAKADLWLRTTHPQFASMSPVKYASIGLNHITGKGDNLRDVEEAISLIRG